MSLVIDQSARAVGEEHWDWSVWVDGPDAELDQVKSVEWILDPTFDPPTVLVDDRESKFKLDSSGWGGFEISALVMAKDGRQQHLKHWLQLAGIERGSRALLDEGSAVFVSAGVADGKWEDAVREALARHGVDVFTASDLPAGVPAETAIGSMLDQTNAVVGIFSAKPGPWAEREVMQALHKDVPVVPLVVGPNAKLPAGLGGREALHITELSDVDSAVDRIVGKLS